MTHSSPRRTPNGRSGQRVRMLIALGLVSTTLVACNAHNRNYTKAVPLASVEDRHPILHPGDFKIHDILVGNGEGRLSAKERSDVKVFLNGYRENGAGPLFIATPQGTANESAAVYRVGEVRHIAQQAGVPDNVLVVEPYTPVEGEFGFPISLRYQVHRMVVPQCGRHGDMAANWENSSYENFGCSRQRNLAVMVANPNDLRHPRAQEPRHAPERDRVLKKYAAGEKTQSGNNQATEGNISDVGE